MLAHVADVAALEDGGNTDFRFPDGRGVVFEPIVVDRALEDEDTIQLGGTVLTLLHHPGHPKGASSFEFTVDADGERYSVLIVNMGTINDGVELLNMPEFPDIAEAYASTFAAQKQLTPDIWVSSHASHFDLHEKYSPGDPFDPNRFVDPEGYLAKIRNYEDLYLNQLRDEESRRAQ